MRRLIGFYALVVLLAASCTAEQPPPRAEGKPVRDADARCTSEEDAPVFYAENATYRDPDALTLEEGDPEALGVDTALLRAATREMERSPDVLSFLVMRRGRLIWERYFNGSEPTHAENGHSASKSILSLAVGKAVEDGKLELTDPIGRYLPEGTVPDDRGNITVEDLLSMSAGLEWHENETEFSDVAGERDYVRAILSQERVAESGEEFRYSTGLSQVLSAVLTEATGTSTCRYVTREVLAPIGVTVDHWLTMPDGYDAGGHSVFLTPREFARIGQLVLDDGEGRIERRWLRTSLTERWPLGCGAPSQDRGYGYLWWLSDIGGVEVWEAQGYGGQAVMIVPSLDLVMVMTHDTYGDDLKQIVPITEVLTNYVLPAAGATLDPDDRCRSFDLYRTELDRAGITRLTDHPTLDTWGAPSPDGRTIAFATRRDLNFEIYTMKTDGSKALRLTDDTASDAFPAWSPDGKLIAFARDGSQEGIYTMRPDGSRTKRLTRGMDDTVAWSHDGRRIAFHRGSEDGPGDIRTMTARGRNIDAVDGTEGGIAPDWSPDDETIAYYTREQDAEVVYTIDADGGKPERIAQGSHPRFLPDGSLLFSQRPSDGTARIVRRSLDGDIEVVVDTPGDDLLAIPSADGEWVVWSSASSEVQPEALRAPEGSGAAKMTG